MPASVSMVISSPATLCSYSHWATQRMPLPHMALSLPSALNMRMVASATWEGAMQISPSDPTENRRGLNRRASSGALSIMPFKQSR